MAEKYEQQKKLLLAARQLQERRFSDVGMGQTSRPFCMKVFFFLSLLLLKSLEKVGMLAGFKPETYNGDRRRHSDLPINYTHHPRLFHPNPSYASPHQGPSRPPTDPLPPVQKNSFCASKLESRFVLRLLL